RGRFAQRSGYSRAQNRGTRLPRHPAVAYLFSLRRMHAPSLKRYWRHYLLFLIAAVSIVILLCLPPIHQDARYHEFADRRHFLGIPNFADVISNAPFLIIGLAGIILGATGRLTGYSICWFTFFLGVSLVSVGSGYYHWDPNNDSLVWDR